MMLALVEVLERQHAISISPLVPLPKRLETLAVAPERGAYCGFGAVRRE